VSGGASEGAHADQIRVDNGSHVPDVERYQGFGPSGSRDELDFQAITFVDVDHRTEVTTPQTMVRKVLVQNDHV
jgi:hypothetical protein